MKVIVRLSVFCFLILGSGVLEAQEPGPKATKTPYFNFRNGIGFATPDSAYSLNLRFRIQNRALMNTVSDEDLETGFIRSPRTPLSPGAPPDMYLILS